MNLDTQLVESLNQFAHMAPTLDVIITYVTRSNLFKGGVMIAFLWWGWFKQGPTQHRQQRAVMSILLAALLTLITARLLASALPFRARPMHDMSVDMVLPIGMPPMLAGWSSFPSDHAALFGCLASGMFLLSKRAGWLATAYCVLFIMVPRVYSGLHYPTDILGGYAIGILFTWLCSRQVAMAHIITPAYNWFLHRPGLWYPLFFLASYQVVTLFDELRHLGDLGQMIIERHMTGNESIKHIQ